MIFTAQGQIIVIKDALYKTEGGYVNIDYKST